MDRLVAAQPMDSLIFDKVAFLAINVDEPVTLPGGECLLSRLALTAQQRWQNLQHFHTVKEGADAFEVFFVPEKVIVNQHGMIAAQRQHGWKGRLQAADIAHCVNSLLFEMTGSDETQLIVPDLAGDREASRQSDVAKLEEEAGY
jgi:hypothetical protein